MRGGGFGSRGPPLLVHFRGGRRQRGSVLVFRSQFSLSGGGTTAGILEKGRAGIPAGERAPPGFFVSTTDCGRANFGLAAPRGFFHFPSPAPPLGGCFPGVFISPVATSPSCDLFPAGANLSGFSASQICIFHRSKGGPKKSSSRGEPMGAGFPKGFNSAPLGRTEHLADLGGQASAIFPAAGGEGPRPRTKQGVPGAFFFFFFLRLIRRTFWGRTPGGP